MEDKWINYDDEEAEVQLELADLIFDKLVTETTELILGLHKGNLGQPNTKLKSRLQEDDSAPQEPQLVGSQDQDNDSHDIDQEDTPEAAMRRIQNQLQSSDLIYDDDIPEDEGLEEDDELDKA